MQSVPRLIAEITAQGGTLKLVDDHLEIVCGPTPLIASTEIEIKTRFEEVKRYLVAQASARRGPPQPRSTIPTPSFTQQLWWQWQGGKAGISAPSLTVPIIRFMRASSLEMVEAAVRSVIARHDILRWRFVDDGGSLKIIVNDPSCFIVERDVLECTSQEDISRATLQQMEEFSRRAIFATDDWLTRAKVIQLTKRDFVAMLVSNHIISDGRSAQIINDELDRLVCDGCIAEEPGERLQFSDYVWWEKDWFARSGDKVISYWRDWQKQLRPFLAPTTGRELIWLPGEKTSYKIHFDPNIAAMVKNAARKLSSTPALIYLTALALGTINWSRQSQFAVRCAGDARSHPRWQRVVGLITAADPVCIEANGCVEFDEILQSLQCELRSAMMLRAPSLHAYPRVLLTI